MTLYNTKHICRWLVESDVTVHHQPRVWIDYVSEIITRLLQFPLLTNMNEKRKSTSPSTIHVKNQACGSAKTSCRLLLFSCMPGWA